MPRRMMIIVIGVVFLTPMVRAMDLQSLTDIEQAAYMHAYEEAMAHYNNPQIVVDALDDRLRLSSCEQSLITFSKTAPNTLGNRTIGVKCQMPTDWTVYVPVKVKVLKKVVVATRPLAARQVLSRQDLQIQMMDISELNQGYLLKVSDVVGRQLKYPLAAGAAFTPRSLKLQKVVRRGEQILLVAATSAMEVRMNGTALEDASVGETIKVKNSSSQRVVEGVVEAPGIVKVTM